MKANKPLLIGLGCAVAAMATPLAWLFWLSLVWGTWQRPLPDPADWPQPLREAGAEMSAKLPGK